ncbi:MAG: HD-GYP domain-containing protein [Rhodanobacteraceae bacterium]|nr:HD-GYP domain-containing protein [Rhodanobacteraceae bacterium]MBL0042417.1 HD-GYP domain-containing protein [Xanthomonadales bacterium]MBP6077336.1 HD-GYP domain-containing protein [Xanthomonadales bacterium]MBP7625057.1 HD-GYP domain-containing protein [Xanthomonadales bacterium]
MELEERQVHVDHLKPEMYVYRLDRPWLGLPFPLEGFMVQNAKQIEVLRKHCDHVFVDVQRSQIPIRAYMAHPRQHERQRTVVKHVDSVTLHEELPRAREAHDQASHLAAKILSDVKAGHKISVEDVRNAVVPVVKSVLRNADAYFWVTSLRKRDAYEYSHAVHCSLLAAAFGRHMGFTEDVLVNLATGGLLMDIGKTEIDESLLAKPEALTADETEAVRKHVENSLRIIEEAGIHHADVREMVLTHHERHDGSGYPDKLMRNQIPLFGRMAGLIDSYDAMTSTRVFRKAASAHHALQQLYRHGDQLFQREVVEQLMQCLSVYPTGSLVELSNGEVAIVMAQNHARRLRPRVMLLMTADKVLRENFIELDLMGQNEDEGTLREITTILEPGAYGLDPTELYLG